MDYYIETTLDYYISEASQKKSISINNVQLQRTVAVVCAVLRQTSTKYGLFFPHFGNIYVSYHAKNISSHLNVFECSH